MVAWGALVGAALAWAVVLALGVAAGYGLVQAWSRWGARVPLPEPLRRGLELGLGMARAAPTPAPGSAALPAALPALPVPPLPPPAAPVASAPAALASPAAASEAAPAPDAAAQPPEAGPEPVPPPPAPVLPRGDAVAELAAVFAVAYDEAVALLEAGLWGAGNFDEWSRSVRGSAPPANVPDEVFRRIVALAPKEVEAAAVKHREKRAATRGLETLWGVGPEEAEALFAAGYRDMAAIRKASTDKLAKVPGIGPARAFQIRAAAHGLAPTA